MYGKYLVLFAILFTGWVLRKTDFIDDKMDHSMNKLIVYFAYPCLIVHNIGSLEMSSRVITQFLLTFVLSVAFMYLYGLTARGYAALRKFPKEDAPVAECSMMMANDGFMGFPVALIFFGETGLLLMLAHNAALNFCMFTYCLSRMRQGGDYERKFSIISALRAGLKVLVNPNILALFIGFAISLSPFGIPAAADEYLTMIGNVSTPMAMIYIGSTLSTCSMKEIIRDRITIESSVMKLLAMPALTLAIVYFLPLDPMVKITMVLGASFPSAATVSMISEQEDLNPRVAIKILFMSTVVSVATLPLIIKIISLVL